MSSTETTSPTSDRYSSLFPIYDEADLVVRSCDGILFATRKVFLRAASSVLDDVLSMGREGEKRDGRAMLQLSEKGEEIEPFLRIVQRDDGENKFTLDLKNLVQLSPLVEKYEITVLSSYLLAWSIEKLLPKPPSTTRASPSDVLSLLALAIIHDKLDAAKTIIESLEGWYVYEYDSDRTFYYNPTVTVPSSDGSVRRRRLGIEDFPDELLERMSARAIKSFGRASRKVADEKDYTWASAARDFKF
ncbi:hypothetical protein BDY24DRAFT_382521 [Mrakia frigida]|uniref:uncharacterized protein n=1 Tax=Mrakia frigida TaxID=29902 RepID=UPI003FCC0EC2